MRGIWIYMCMYNDFADELTQDHTAYDKFTRYVILTDFSVRMTYSSLGSLKCSPSSTLTGKFAWIVGPLHGRVSY